VVCPRFSSPIFQAINLELIALVLIKYSLVFEYFHHQHKEVVMANASASSTIKINDKEYDINTLSEDAKNQLGSIQFVDAELARLAAQVAVYQTARNSYLGALAALLPAVD
jgi:hypothetical protein